MPRATSTTSIAASSPHAPPAAGSAGRGVERKSVGYFGLRAVAAKIHGLDFERIEGLGHMPQFVEAGRVVAFIERIAARAFADVS